MTVTSNPLSSRCFTHNAQQPQVELGYIDRIGSGQPSRVREPRVELTDRAQHRRRVGDPQPHARRSPRNQVTGRVGLECGDAADPLT